MKKQLHCFVFFALNSTYFVEWPGCAIEAFSFLRQALLSLVMRCTLPPLLLALLSEAAATSSLVTYLKKPTVLTDVTNSGQNYLKKKMSMKKCWSKLWIMNEIAALMATNDLFLLQVGNIVRSFKACFSFETVMIFPQKSLVSSSCLNTQSRRPE